jgi:hypothetical protein
MTCVRRSLRGCMAAGVALVALAAAAVPATAQENASDEVREVEVSYEIGAYDGQRRDWPIVAVVVRGDLDPEQDLNVELWGEGYRLWIGSSAVTLPVTRLEVDQFVPVGELVEVGIWQQLPEDETIEVIVPPGLLPAEVVPPEEPAADEVDPEDELDPEEEEEVDPEEAVAPTEVGGTQVGPRRAEVIGGGAGGGASGQLALSMVLTVVVLTILFRTPLPSASTQRWTR